jgi:hypothetical protein
LLLPLRNKKQARKKKKKRQQKHTSNEPYSLVRQLSVISITKKQLLTFPISGVAKQTSRKKLQDRKSNPDLRSSLIKSQRLIINVKIIFARNKSVRNGFAVTFTGRQFTIE